MNLGIGGGFGDINNGLFHEVVNVDHRFLLRGSRCLYERQAKVYFHLVGS